MSRRVSFTKLVTDIAREQARQEREQEKRARDIQRRTEMANREAIRLRVKEDKEAKQLYLESRIEETQERCEQLEEQILELNKILEHTLKIDDTISFANLRIKEKFRAFSLPTNFPSEPKAPEVATFLKDIKKPGTLQKLIPGVEERYQKAIEQANKHFQESQKLCEEQKAKRELEISKLREAYDKEKQAFELQVQERNKEIDDFESAYHNGDPAAVTAYASMVLEHSSYPEGFPQEFKIAYVPESKEIVIDYELPTIEVIPTVSEFRYVRTKDLIESKPRKVAEIKEQYQDIVASVCLRTIHEIFEADQDNHLLLVTFSGSVQTVDPSTGHDIRPCLISVRASKEKFSALNLTRIDKRACLRNLGAQISSRPDEMLAVKPIVEFDMVDKRFVEQSDVLSDLESRPNLMELTPFEFENLVGNLFQQIGFQTKLTRTSKDGGVDAIAFDPRPILGGKVVIQAKRYKNVVGVSAVRDLYGTMINEGAGKGILVATSHYGPDAYEFAKDKPIELIDGGGLIYLLEQQGTHARIIMPSE